MAYKLILAEDEPIERSALRFIISNYTSWFEIAAEVSNGIELMELARTILADVFVIDIKMPAIDGISAMAQIKEFLPDSEFIIVSAHTDFEYAQQALRLGAADYLTKPIKNEKLIHSLHTCYNKLIDRDHKRKQNLILDEKIKLFKPEIEKSIFHAVASMEVSDDIELQFAQYWDTARKFFIGFVIFQDQERYLNSVHKEGIVNFYRKNLGLICDEFMIGFTGEYLVILLPCTDKNANAYQKEIGEHLLKCYPEIKFGTNLSILCSFPDLKSLVVEYMEFKRAYISRRTALGLNNIKKTSELYRHILNLCEEMASGDIKTTDSLLNKIHFYIRSETDNAPKDELNYIKEMFTIIKSFMFSNREAYNTLIGYFNETGLRLENEDNPEQTFYELAALVNRCVEYYKTRNTNDPDSRFSEIIDYINKNFTLDISLESLANKYNMSSSAISKAFKQRFKKNFIDYVTELRMEKAKKLLLTSGKSIKEITFETGYNSQTYFCKVFKKETGLSASDYKEKQKSTL
jgi:two-component system response regulator YesN